MNLIYRDTFDPTTARACVQPGGVLRPHSILQSETNRGRAGRLDLGAAFRSDRSTLVMPSMSYEDDLPFHKTKSHCAQLGVTADTFWRLPGVLRSDNNHAFAAAGPQAERITAPHPIDIPHGLDSPVGRAYELDGQVLLLGVDHGSNTTIHLCENMAGVRRGKNTSRS